MTNNLLKNLAYTILSWFNFPGAIILMYHSVAENNEFSTVRPADFKAQMAYFKKRKFNIIKLKDLEQLLINKKKIPPKTIVLTFDDGYEDNYKCVWPILKQYNFPATFFISTGFLGQDFITPRGTSLRVINDRQIIELDRSGLIEIASHGHKHLKLANLSAEEAKNELKNSLMTLEGILKKKILSISYPSGRFNDMVENIAKEYFSVICTVLPGRVKNNDKIYRLKRNSVDSEVTFTQFKGIIKYGRV